MKSIHNKVRSVIAAIVCVFCTLALIPTHNAYASVNSFTRIAGNTRYETMSQIVEQAFLHRLSMRCLRQEATSQMHLPLLLSLEPITHL